MGTEKTVPSPDDVKSASAEVNQEVTDAEDLTTEAPEEVPESDIPAEGETKPSGVSVIKRGVPKNTKPAPAVVAIKMVDLLSAPDDEVDQDQEYTTTGDVSSPDHIKNEIDDVKSKELLEKQ